MVRSDEISNVTRSSRIRLSVGWHQESHGQKIELAIDRERNRRKARDLGQPDIERAAFYKNMACYSDLLGLLPTTPIRSQKVVRKKRTSLLALVLVAACSTDR